MITETTGMVTIYILWYGYIYIYWTKKKRTSISAGNLISVKTVQWNCLVWVKSAICHESSFATQKFIVTFCPVQKAVKCSKVNNLYDKPCASCTTLHLCDMNGIRWVILTSGMSIQTSWITSHNCTMVCGGGSRDLIWQSVRSCSRYTTRAVYG